MNLDNIEQRLLRNSILDPITGCWEWQGKKDKYGYGQMTVRVAGRPSPINVYVHRMAVIVFQGKQLNRSLHVDHLCRHPACLNPEHLIVRTARTNLARRRLNTLDSQDLRASGVYRRKDNSRCSRCGFNHSVESECKK